MCPFSLHFPHQERRQCCIYRVQSLLTIACERIQTTSYISPYTLALQDQKLRHVADELEDLQKSNLKVRCHEKVRHIDAVACHSGVRRSVVSTTGFSCARACRIVAVRSLKHSSPSWGSSCEAPPLRPPRALARLCKRSTCAAAPLLLQAAPQQRRRLT